MQFKIAIGSLSAIAVIASMSSAEAADLRAPNYKASPPVVYSSWTGCYVGASGGYIKSRENSVSVTGDPFFESQQALGNIPYSIDPKGDGYLVGGQIGCNYEVNRIVYGIETDLSYVDAARTFSTVQGPNVVTAIFDQDLKYLGTVRGRIGFAFESVLLYATGGLAYGKVNTSVSMSDAAGFALVGGSQSKVQVGYTVGGGVEYALNVNWSVKGEYLYYDLGNEALAVNTIFGPVPVPGVFHHDASGHILRAGLNYRF